MKGCGVVVVVLLMIVGIALGDGTFEMCRNCDKTVEVQYEVFGNTTICFSAQVEAPGYLSIAFNLPSAKPGNVMANADYYVALFEPVNKTDAVLLATVEDMWGQDIAGGGPPTPDVFLGGMENAFYPPVSSYQVDGASAIAFCRPLKTRDEFDHDIILGQELFLMVAYGQSNALNYHGPNRDFRLVNFTSPTAPDGPPEPPRDLDRDRRRGWHAGLMSIAFAILMPWGAFIAKYMKSYWWWFPLHIAMQMLAVAFSVAAFVMIVLYVPKEISFTFWHSYVGLAALILAWITPILGVLAHFMWNPEREGTPIFPDRLHWYTARLTILLGFVSIGLGLDYLQKNTLIYPFGILCVLYLGGYGAIEVARMVYGDSVNDDPKDMNDYEIINSERRESSQAQGQC